MRKNLLTLLYILAACIVILSAVRLIGWLRAPRFPELKFNPKKAAGLTIKSPKTDLSFYKEGDVWRVKTKFESGAYDFICDSNAVQATLDAIAGMAIAEVISNNPARFTEFEVDDSSGVKIGIKVSGGRDVSFILGKRGYDADHYYFRFPGQNQIRHSTGLRRDRIERSADGWRNARILELDRSLISRLEINYPSNSRRDLILSLLPGTSEHWVAENVLSSGKPKDANFATVIKPLLYQICDFINNGYMPPDTKWGSTKFTVKVTSKKGTYKIFVGDKIEEIYYLVKKEGEENIIYKIRDYKMENIYKERSDIK